MQPFLLWNGMNLNEKNVMFAIKMEWTARLQSFDFETWTAAALISAAEGKQKRKQKQKTEHVKAP